MYIVSNIALREKRKLRKNIKTKVIIILLSYYSTKVYINRISTFLIKRYVFFIDRHHILLYSMHRGDA